MSLAPLCARRATIDSMTPTCFFFFFFLDDSTPPLRLSLALLHPMDFLALPSCLPLSCASHGLDEPGVLTSHLVDDDADDLIDDDDELFTNRPRFLFCSLVRVWECAIFLMTPHHPSHPSPLSYSAFLADIYSGALRVRPHSTWDAFRLLSPLSPSLSISRRCRHGHETLELWIAGLDATPICA